MRLYPDETVYSICSRIHASSGEPYAISTMDRVFKGRSTTAHVIWKTGLQQLADFLGRDVAEIIENHSFLPYFDKFCLQEKKQRLKDILIYGQGNVPKLLGYQKYSNSSLFLCPKCAEDDIKQFGEPYWHRSHQLPGSLVCFKHNVRLVNECRICKEQLMSKPFEWVATPTICSNGHFLLEPVNNENECLLSIAVENDYILNLKQDISFEEVQKKLIKFARLKRYLNINSSVVNYKRLYQELLCQFPQSMLREIDHQIKGNEDLWLRRVFWKKRYCSRYPPSYIIVIIYLKETMQKFLEDDAETRPFGKGPWPCKNLICSQYNGQTIMEISLTTSYKLIIGTFKCPECGFSYTRHTSNIDFYENEENTKIQTIKETGHLWDEKLEDLLQKDEVIYVKSIAKELNVGTCFITRRLRNRITELDGLTKSKLTDTKQIHRNKILKVMAAQPGIKRSDVIKTARAAYQWLRVNDSEWIYEVLPKDDLVTLEQRRAKMLTIVNMYPGLSRNELKKIDITTYEWLIKNDYDWIKTILPAVRSKRLFYNDKNLEDRRASYLQLRQVYPLYSKTEIIKLDPSNYQWLRQYDREWLIEHQPQPKKSYASLNVSLEERRSEFIQILLNNPQALRNDLKRLCGNNYTYLQRRDTEWFKKQLPELSEKRASTKQKLSKEQRRNLYLELIKLHPEMSRTQLKQHDGSNYAWLYRNDKDWLFTNSPPIRTRSETKC